MKIYGIIRTAIYWTLTALVIVFVSTLAEIEALRYFIGGLMIFFGAEEIVHTVFTSKKHYVAATLYWNLIEIVIGLTMIIFVETGDQEVTYAVVCVSWAIWEILRETRELVDVTEALKKHKLTICRIVAVLDLLESLVAISLSLTMLIEPGEHHATIHIYLLSVDLFIKVLFPIINYAATRKEEKKRAKAASAEPDALQSEPVDAPQSETADTPQSENTEIPEPVDTPQSEPVDTTQSENTEIPKQEAVDATQITPADESRTPSA